MSGYLRVRDPYLARVLSDIADERARQDEKWGQQDHPDGTGPEMWHWPAFAVDGHPGVTVHLTAAQVADLLRKMCQQAFAEGVGTWRHVLLEELAEAIAEDDLVKLRAELIQVNAVGVAWVQAIDRRLAGGGG